MANDTSDLENIKKLAEAADIAGNCASAFEMFRRIIALDPANDSANYRAAKNLLQLGRLTDAEIYLNRIKRNAAPKPWLIEIAYGELHLARFNLAEAERHFARAWEMGRCSSVPAVFFGDYLFKQERFNEASAVLVEAISTAQDELDEVYLNLGFVKRAQGDYSAARDFLLKALEIDPDYEEAKRVLADIDMCLSVGVEGVKL